MPSDRKQLNMRLDPETERTIPAIQAAMAERTGLRVSTADVVRLAVQAYAESYLPAEKGAKKNPRKSPSLS